jgi:hypothetical protein
MARKRNPADAAVEFFQTATPESANAVLEICRGIVTRRLKGGWLASTSVATAHAAAEGARRPARRSRDVGPGEVSTPEGGAPGAAVTRQNDRGAE